MLKPGYVLSNRYQVIKPLGQGGQSNVYLLKDLRLKGKRWVAKEMTAQYTNPRDQSLAKKHFEMEANILATLEHANLPKVIDYFSQGGKHYLIMQYLEGDDLGKLLRRAKKPFTEEQVVSWAIQVATVLYYLHCQKPPIIFRDIKPSNIIIHGGQVKLIDFGIARHFNPAKKGDTLRIGSPGYSPPEQYSGQTDQRSDIYSLGITMYHLLTLQDPSKTQTPFQLPPLKIYNKNVSSRLISVIEKCIQIEQGKRFNSALELKKELRDLLAAGKTKMVAPPAVTAPYNPAAQTVLAPPPQQSPQPPVQAGQTVLTPPPLQAGSVTVPASGPAQAEILTVPTPPPDQKAGVPQQVQALNAQAAPPPGQQVQKPPAKAGAGGKAVGIIIVLVIILGLLGGGYYAATQTDLLKQFIGKTPIPVASPSEEPGKPLELGKKYYDEGDYRNAVLQLVRARQKNPGDSQTLLLLNRTYDSVAGAPSASLGVLIPPADEKEKTDDKFSHFLSGVILAQRTVNFNGGINGKTLSLNIVRLTGDEKSDRESIKNLVDSKPMAIITPRYDSKNKQLMEMTGKKGIAVLSPGVPGSEKDPGNLVTWGNSPEKQMGAMAKFLKTLGKTKIYLVFEAGSFDDYVTVLEKELNNVDIKIVKLISYKRDALNFNLSLEEKKELAPDAIVILGNESGAAYFVNTLRRNGFDTDVFLSPGLTRESFLAQCGENCTNLIGLSSFYTGISNSNGSYFSSLYKETYSGAPRLESALGYDLSNIVVFAARKSFPDPEKILSFMNSIKPGKGYKGASGYFGGRMDKTSRWWATVESKEGKWQETGGFSY